MHLKRMFRTTGVVVIATLSSAAAAAQTATLTGTVVNTETKQPLSDVFVTATSPELQGERVVVTDFEGQYRIPELPPGTYSLRFDKESFKPFWRTELTVGTDVTVQADATLFPDGQGGEIQFLLGHGGGVNTRSSTTGTNVEEAFIRRLAVNQPTGRGGAARSFEALADLAPGVEGDADVVSIHGSSPWENAYVVDGLSTQDPVAGANPLPLSVEFLQDFDVFTAGAMPEHRRATGGIIQARTRSGSNEFHGSVFGNWVPGRLGGTPTPISDPSSLILSSQNVLERQGDLGATLGGPLVKDRLWFFAGVAPSSTREEYTRTFKLLVPGEDGVDKPQPLPGQSQTFRTDQRGLQALGKLTYLIHPDHHVSLSALTTPNRSSEAGPVFERQRASESNFTTSAFTYAGAFMDKRLQVEARLGWSRWTGSGPSTPGADTTVVERYQANAQASWLLKLAGTHLLEAGVDADLPTSTRTWSFPGGVTIRDPPGSAPPVQQLSQTSRYSTRLLGGFVQDSWLLFNRVTLNAGLRYDTQWLYTKEGELAVVLGHQLSPRVGLVVDPTARGRMKLFAHYAKYPGQLPLNMMQWAFPARLSKAAGVDPGLVPPSSSELVAGAEYQVLRATRLSATYVHRRLDSVVEGMSRDDGNTYFLGNPGMGLASTFPKAERTYGAVTVALSRVFTEGWLAQASYTWSRLEGNYTGPLLGEFQMLSHTQNRSGLLPYDRTHSLKLFGARAFHFTPALSANLGLSYRGRSGTPFNYLGGHLFIGPGETFILPRGSSGERTPWIHTLDSNVGLTYRLGGSKAVSLTVDVFNLFNFQEATRVDQNYTFASVLPTVGIEPGKLTPDRVTRINEDTA
ncbi:MAG TPA: TonB-dependent receptor, partial [Archangium sp.]|nr:TonB-dependent receptor [Archangium sp.]